jgi:hypothetical protein
MPTSAGNQSSQHAGLESGIASVMPLQMKEVETEGIINLTLKKISGTLFKVVKEDVASSSSQPETSKDKEIAHSPN